MKYTKKYKQTIIPEVSTDYWEQFMPTMARKKMFEFYNTHYFQKKRVINQHLGIAVEFDATGGRKTCFGSGVYPKKKCLIEVLDKMIRYAEYSNFGERKPKDPANVIGYLNFNVKVRIDGKIEYIHLIIRMTNNGKFHYSMEVNVWK